MPPEEYFYRVTDCLLGSVASVFVVMQVSGVFRSAPLFCSPSELKLTQAWNADCHLSCWTKAKENGCWQQKDKTLRWSRACSAAVFSLLEETKFSLSVCVCVRGTCCLLLTEDQISDAKAKRPLFCKDEIRSLFLLLHVCQEVAQVSFASEVVCYFEVLWM